MPAPATSRVRLPKLSSAPTQDDIRQFFATAKEQPNREIGLSWAHQATLQDYLLVVIQPKVMEDKDLTRTLWKGQPIWTLFEDDGDRVSPVWRYETDDLDFVSGVLQALESQQPARSAHLRSSSDNNAGRGGDSTPASATGNGHGSKVSVPPGASAPPDGWNNPPAAEAIPAPPYRGSASAEVAAYNAAVDQVDADDAVVTARADAPEDDKVPLAQHEDAPAEVVGQIAAETSFVGELGRVPLPELLKHIGRESGTGVLEVLGDGGLGKIYFEDGQPYHAMAEEVTGDDAFNEIFLWTAGTFSFQPDVMLDEGSITQSLELCIMEGMTIIDQRRRLEEAGVSMDCRFVRSESIANEAHLQLTLSRGANISWELQKNVFYRISSELKLMDLLRDCPMAAHQWVPLLYNFAACGVIQILPAESSAQMPLAFLADVASVERLRNTLIKEETKLHSFEAFLLELEKEFYRYKHYGWPLSIVLFELKQQTAGGAARPLPQQAITMVAMRIHMVKRALDTVAHFEKDDFAILLPNTTGPSAAFVANRVWQALTAAPLAPGVDKNSLSMAFGVCSLGAECPGLEQLIMAARLSMNQAKSKTYPVMLSRTSRKR